MFCVQVDGMRIVDVREAIRFSRDYALRNGPIVIEMITYRYFGHSMSDPGFSYRTREEIKTMQTEQDPILLFTKLIVEKGLMTERDVEVQLLNILKLYVYISVRRRAHAHTHTHIS